MSKELKILINNEEVVCDKQISIDEKMLSTSSTILKNCYPKFWETDKDYTSRFYFPKDYSKCRISYDEFHPEEQGEIVTGTNLSINYDSTKNFELLQLQGNTTQQTYTGKNLFDKSISPSSNNGTTESKLETGIRATVTTAGTNKYTAINLPNPSNLLGKTLTLSANISISGTNSALIRFYWLNGNTLTGLIANTISTTGSSTFTIPSSFPTNTNGIAIVFSSNAGSSTSQVGNYVDYTNVQLEVGSTQTSYEPYVGGTPSPNPDYPQPINNVTGRQTIDVVGKNLFDKQEIIDNEAYLNKSNVSNLTTNSSGISWKATGNDSYISLPATITGGYGMYIEVEENTQYALSFNSNYELTNYIHYIKGDYTFISRNNSLGHNNTVFTTPANCKYIFIRFGVVNQSGNTVNITNIQIEKGSTATTYEEYKGQSYEINLGKNLFDKDNANVLNAYFNTSTNKLTQSGAGVKSLYIPCKPNTTYTVQKTLSTRFGVACTREIPIIGETIYNASVHATWSNITITTDSQAKYLVVEYYISSDTLTPEEIMDTIQIEQGSTATTYSSYFPPIELNKIGNYQDRIYKENDTWYIEKKIGKVVFDGSTNAFGYSSSNSVFVTDTLSTLIKKNTTMIANYYNQVDNTTTYANMTTGQMKLDGTNSGRIIIKDTRYTSANDYKIWLQSNNLILYYVLSTPTYTEITNTDLINQLESIELLYGINNITVTSPNVPGALKIHYNFKEAYTESDLVFCGVVKNTGNISLNPREPHYVDLQILDFKCLLSEGETLNYVINDKTIPEAIEQVVTSISDYGFVIGNINILNPNDKINAYSTLNKTAYDVFQYIADVTQSKWATRVIDEDTIAIDFYDPTLMPQASPIEYNQTYFENNDIENMTFNYSTNDYRNKQIMTSDEVFGNIEQIETIISNGYQDTYTCQNKIGIIKKITVNDVEYTFATKNEVELGVTADFIYQPGEIVFTSSQIYTSGSVIVITYLPIVKGREIVLNNEESSRISSQINRKGTISRYENRNDTTSGQELIKIGQSYIKYKGSAEITLKIVSSKNLFNVGQIVEFNAPLEELSTEYMVKNKTIDIWTIDSNETQVFYTYELSSNFNSENAINYFDNQRAKNQGNIGEGETIVRNIDIENTALIQFYETNIEEVEISNISTLDFSLDAVLI